MGFFLSAWLLDWIGRATQVNMACEREGKKKEQRTSRSCQNSSGQKEIMAEFFMEGALTKRYFGLEPRVAGLSQRLLASGKATDFDFFSSHKEASFNPNSLFL